MTLKRKNGIEYVEGSENIFYDMGLVNDPNDYMLPIEKGAKMALMIYAQRLAMMFIIALFWAIVFLVIYVIICIV